MKLPVGVGALIVDDPYNLNPIILGGGQGKSTGQGPKIDWNCWFW